MTMVPVNLASAMFLATIVHNRLWYAIPLILSVSLVYAATRHELIGPIVDHAMRFGGWLVGFLVIFFVILLLVSAWL